MKSSEKNIQNLDLAFDNLFDNDNKDYDIEAKILASKVLSDISHITDRKKLNRKNIAELIGTSASYLTQLYRGTKLLNLITLVKLKDKLDLDIEIRIKEKSYDNFHHEYEFTNFTKEITHGLKTTKWAIYTNDKDSLQDMEVIKSSKSSKKRLTA